MRIPVRWLAATILASFAAASVEGQAPPSGPRIAETLDAWISNTEKNVVSAAEAMPADRYGFAPPTTVGEFSGVRTFGEQVRHIAALNLWMADLINGVPAPPEVASEIGPVSLEAKPELLRYLHDSFAAVHAAVATITADNANAPIPSTSLWQRTRLSFTLDVVAHGIDHYGQMVEYLRMNGIVPPASRPAQKAARGK